MKQIFKTPLLILTLTTGISHVSAHETRFPTATCRFTDSTIHESIELYSPFRNSFIVHHTPEMSFKQSNVLFSYSSWVTYIAQFKYEGESVSLEFSNYYSPSEGIMKFSDGREIEMTCVLSRLSKQNE